MRARQESIIGPGTHADAYKPFGSDVTNKCHIGRKIETNYETDAPAPGTYDHKGHIAHAHERTIVYGFNKPKFYKVWA